jgi:hypothetical protein
MIFDADCHVRPLPLNDVAILPFLEDSGIVISEWRYGKQIHIDLLFYTNS